ncbi:hypothetical protein [Halalkalicoccus salilacus]|uniref:hypothetical protein n=1 Tax=Halalkalicoccus TaxID=332246 RepID=UPI002F96DB3B
MTFSVARSPQTIRREERGVLASKSLKFAGQQYYPPRELIERRSSVLDRSVETRGNNLSILHRRDRFLWIEKRLIRREINKPLSYLQAIIDALDQFEIW